MANPIADPALWEDYYGNSPHPTWNGSAYEFLGEPGESAYLRYIGPQITEPFDLIATRNSSDEVSIIVSVDSAESTYPLDIGVPQTITVPVGANIWIMPRDDRTSQPYALDVTIAPPASKCTELGRVTRCYVSGYQLDRVHESRVVRGTKRCLVANFNGAFDTSRTITSVTWQCQQPYAAVMSNARVFPREVAVDVTAQLPGCSLIKCLATLDNGEVYPQLFRVLVMDAAWFDIDPGATAGPLSLTSP